MIQAWVRVGEKQTNNSRMCVGAGLKTPGDLGKILDGTEELLDRVVRPGGERSVDTSSSRVSWIRCPLVVSCSIDSLDHRPPAGAPATRPGCGWSSTPRTLLLLRSKLDDLLSNQQCSQHLLLKKKKFSRVCWRGRAGTQLKH